MGDLPQEGRTRGSWTRWVCTRCGPHQPRRRGDRPDGQEEQPEEVTLPSSNHSTPEPTKGFALEGRNFNPKVLPRAGQRRLHPAVPATDSSHSTKQAQWSPCIRRDTNRQTHTLLKRVSTGWSTPASYSTATLGWTAAVQQRGAMKQYRGTQEGGSKSARDPISAHVPGAHNHLPVQRRWPRAPGEQG